MVENLTKRKRGRQIFRPIIIWAVFGILLGIAWLAVVVFGSFSHIEYHVVLGALKWVFPVYLVFYAAYGVIIIKRANETLRQLREPATDTESQKRA